MKTNPLFRIFKLPALAPLAIPFAAVLVTQPVFAQGTPPHSIVLTENSSTSLTATYDGSTSGVSFTFVSPNNWMVTFPTTISFNDSSLSWDEPENSSLVNFVDFPLGSNSLSVFSDIGHGNLQSFPDETTVNNSVGTDSRDGGFISATFDDDGDTSAVPETGSTFGLLFLALLGVLGASRLRFVRLA